jgi:GTP-binding protein HflX
VAISAATKQGLGDLQDSVIEMLSANFVRAVVRTDQANGKVLAYLSAHAEIERQEYDGNRVTITCQLPRHLFHHITGPGIEVRFLDEPQPASEEED